MSVRIRSKKIGLGLGLGALLVAGGAMPANAASFQAWEHANYKGRSTYVYGNPTFVDVPNNTVSSVRNHTRHMMAGHNERFGWFRDSIIVQYVSPGQSVGYLARGANDTIDWFAKA